MYLDNIHPLTLSQLYVLFNFILLFIHPPSQIWAAWILMGVGLYAAGWLTDEGPHP